MRHRSDILPLLLKVHKDVGCFSPFCAFFQGFSFLTQGSFLFNVGILLLALPLEEISLCSEERIAQSTKTVEKLGIDFLVGET